MRAIVYIGSDVAGECISLILKQNNKKTYMTYYGKIYSFSNFRIDLYKIHTIAMKKIISFISFFLYISLTFAEVSLTPGIYRLIPEDWQKDVDTSHLTGNITAGEKIEIEIQHAIPASSQIKYAVVSRAKISDNRDISDNKMIFLEQENPANTIKDPNVFCKKYAWASSLSNSNFYCHAYKPLFNWTQDSFAIRWVNKKQFINSQYIPAKHKPAKEDFPCFSGGCDSGRVINNYRQIYYNDVFKLETPQPYQDILYLNEDMPLYQEPNQKSPVIKQLYKGNSVAFISKTPDWYQVDDISADGVITHGWINRDDLIKVQWYPQKAKTPLFRFLVGVDKTTNSPVAIAVIDRKTNARVQVLRDIYPCEKIKEHVQVVHDRDIFTCAQISDKKYDPDPDAFKSDELIRLIDANFDKYPDLLMYGSSGGAGPNNADNYFLYHPKTRHFVFNKELSSMTQLEFDSKNHIVITSMRGSCCDHYSETYRFINNQLKLIKTWERYSTSDKTSETTGTLKNGKMHYRTKTYKDKSH